jgi:pyruvate dehydrogenase E2 component (dihydrolipoamide acetyltransferase)
MATAVVMPRQGNTVESCVITKWYKKKGDLVKAGEPLFNYETDKATFDFESPAAGTLLEVFFGEQQDIPVLTNVGVVGQAGEDISSFKPSAGGAAPAAAPEAKPADQSPAQPAASPAQTEPVAAASSGGDTVSVSPRARQTADRKGVDASSLAGTGPKGRVIERDVLDAAAKGQSMTRTAAAQSQREGLVAPSSGTGIGGRIRAADLANAPVGAVATAGTGIPDAVTEVKLTKIRQIICDRMMQSLQGTAQLTMNTTANASGLLAYRKEVKKHGADMALADITITDLVAFALTRVLPKFPEVNATFENGVLRQFAHAHLALAVDTPRGLMVPVIRFADMLSLNDIATGAKALAAQCVDGSINPDRLSGGTLTLSNLGSFGIESFTPILNPPQVAILGLNTISPKPVSGEDGQFKMVPHIGMSLTIDHRVLDGAPAARFLKSLVAAIENLPLTLAR